MQSHVTDIDDILELIDSEHSGIAEIAHAIRCVPELRTYLARRAIRTETRPETDRILRMAVLLGTEWLRREVTGFAERRAAAVGGGGC